jgi:predicted ATPase
VTYVPIERVEIKNYGCIKNASFKLTPLHALIGPNDSGKSTVLRALRTATQFAAGKFGRDRDGKRTPFDPMIGENTQNSLIALHYTDGPGYSILNKHGDEVQEAVHENEAEVDTKDGGRPRAWNEPGLLSIFSRRTKHVGGVLKGRLATATMVRFDPDFLRAPAQLIPDSDGIAFADERGTGLAGVFDAIVNRDAEAFAEIQADVRARFPSVAKVRLINVSSTHKEIGVTLVDGTSVGAKAMSEGLLYYLGFAALRYTDGSNLFLVEEPENGLHPARITEVMAALREISKSAQVVIATHSPLVVNELQGDEVTVVTRPPEEGTQAVLLKDVPGFDDAAKVYQPGEFWVSYCDGDQETPLLTGSPRK